MYHIKSKPNKQEVEHQNVHTFLLGFRALHGVNEDNVRTF